MLVPEYDLRAVKAAAATILLSTTDEKKLESTLLECMELMGRCVNADRVCFIKNEMRDGKHYYVYHYDWSNELINERAPLPRGLAVPYSTIPDWEIKFANGECLNGPVSQQSQSFRAYFGKLDIKSLFIIPILIEDHFWGLFSFTDCLKERAFTEAEVNILRSASLMMVSAVNRSKQAAQLQISHDRTKT
jgi:GAF domain-containing protein